MAWFLSNRDQVMNILSKEKQIQAICRHPAGSRGRAGDMRWRGVPTGGQPVTVVGMGVLCGQPHSGPVIEGTRDPLLLRPPLPRQLLGLGYLGGGHLLGNVIAVLDRYVVFHAGG